MFYCVGTILISGTEMFIQMIMSVLLIQQGTVVYVSTCKLYVNLIHSLPKTEEYDREHLGKHRLETSRM